MVDTSRGAVAVPMHDRVLRFWETLSTERVIIRLDLRRETDSGAVYHDSAVFSYDAAKAIADDRATLLALVEKAEAERDEKATDGFDERQELRKDIWRLGVERDEARAEVARLRERLAEAEKVIDQCENTLSKINHCSLPEGVGQQYEYTLAQIRAWQEGK